MSYPDWMCFPAMKPAPDWVEPFLGVVRAVQSSIDSSVVSRTSDVVLDYLRPGLVGLGYDVEDRRRRHYVRRPVLFGENGKPRVSYRIDAAHDELGVVVEVEAGRGAQGNAVYRDLIRTPLIAEARFLVLGLAAEYRFKSSGKDVSVRSYKDARELLDAIYASGRLELPFEGVLLFGY